MNQYISEATIIDKYYVAPNLQDSVVKGSHVWKNSRPLFKFTTKLKPKTDPSRMTEPAKSTLPEAASFKTDDVVSEKTSLTSKMSTKTSKKDR